MVIAFKIVSPLARHKFITPTVYRQNSWHKVLQATDLRLRRDADKQWDVQPCNRVVFEAPGSIFFNNVQKHLFSSVHSEPMTWADNKTNLITFPSAPSPLTKIPQLLKIHIIEHLLVTVDIAVRCLQTTQLLENRKPVRTQPQQLWHSVPSSVQSQFPCTQNQRSNVYPSRQGWGAPVARPWHTRCCDVYLGSSRCLSQLLKAE